MMGTPTDSVQAHYLSYAFLRRTPNESLANIESVSYNEDNKPHLNQEQWDWTESEKLSLSGNSL